MKIKEGDPDRQSTLNELKVEKHPDKTFIGWIAKGFDFLGYSFELKWLYKLLRLLAFSAVATGIKNKVL